MWLVYALLTVFLTSILGILFQVVAHKAKEPRAFSFVYNAFILLTSLALVGLVGFGKISLSVWLTGLMILSGIGYGLFQRYQFVVRRHISVPEIQILITPTGLAGYALAIVWLHEVVTPARITGYILVIIATLLVLRKKGLKFTFNKYVFLALFIGAMLSVAGTLDRKVVPHFTNVLTYSLFLWLAQALVTFLPYVKLQDIKHEIRSQSWRIPVLGIINLAVLLFQIAAIRLAPATKVGPVTSTNVILVALLSIIFLKERDRVWLKLIAALLATFGLVLISR